MKPPFDIHKIQNISSSQVVEEKTSKIHSHTFTGTEIDLQKILEIEGLQFLVSKNLTANYINKNQAVINFKATYDLRTEGLKIDFNNILGLKEEAIPLNATSKCEMVQNYSYKLTPKSKEDLTKFANKYRS